MYTMQRTSGTIPPQVWRPTCGEGKGRSVGA